MGKSNQFIKLKEMLSIKKKVIIAVLFVIHSTEKHPMQSYSILGFLPRVQQDPKPL